MPNTLRVCRILIVLAVVASAAHSQVSVTGAMLFSTNPQGAFFGGQAWNTIGGDSAYNLWLAMNPDSSSPVNGPSDLQVGINIPLTPGSSYQFYIFGAPGNTVDYSGLNLFFDGNNATPGISAFGPTNGSQFFPNSSVSTLNLDATQVPGARTVMYSANGVIAVLTNYWWHSPTTPPGSLCQPYVFSPGTAASFYGSFTLQVYPAAGLSLSQSSGSPGTSLTVAGTGFVPLETVNIYAGQTTPSPIGTATADSSGSFNTRARVPPRPYGPSEISASGQSSTRLGAAPYIVTPALTSSRGSGLPGSNITLQGFGFGSGEMVSVYWSNPRVLLGTVSANVAGSFTGSSSLTAAIPSNAQPGTKAVIGVGQTTQAVGVGRVIVVQ